MAVIQELSPHLADLIAAGEVVERPASVVKEIIENAIDAGSTRITIDMEHGGTTYLRISDNGCGMNIGSLKEGAGGCGDCFSAARDEQAAQRERSGGDWYAGLSRRGACGDFGGFTH